MTDLDHEMWDQAVELTKLAAAVPDEVLQAAQDDPAIKGTVLKAGGAYRAPIYADDDIVGFFTPRQEGEVWRLGPVFVMPSSRGKGLASSAVREFMDGRKGRAEIDGDNGASQRLFEASGFVHADGDEWVKEAGIRDWFRKYLPGRPEPAPQRSAVIIKGNPAYIEGNQEADQFYGDLADALKERGFSVDFDAGTPFTSPAAADLWVGHSRGADRLQYAPEGTATISLGPLEHERSRARHAETRARAEALGVPYPELPLDERTPVAEHYQITPAMLAAFDKHAAAIVTELHPQQQRVLDKLDASGGVLVVHGLGSGKTLTSIAAGVAGDSPIEVIAPAPLIANYEKEVAKHVEGELPMRVRSYSVASRDGLDDTGLVVLDEAHRMRNVGTKRHRAIAGPAAMAPRRLLLTGTPIYNAPSDLAPLANIAAGYDVLPTDPRSFMRKHVSDIAVRPTFLQRLLGVTPGLRHKLQNRQDLVEALVGHVDVHAETGGDYPEREDEVISVPMSRRQAATYRFLLNQAPAAIGAKIRAGLPPSKQESRALNAYLSGVRQASNSPRPYIETMTDEEEAQNTPKIQEAVSRLRSAREADRNFRGLVYSNYLPAGIEPYARALDLAAVPYRKFTGATSKRDKARIVEEYNAGDVPVLLVSSSGGEGLDLKGTKMVQILEPHFNNPKINQVIGRGIRHGSHAHLPEEERRVVVQRFLSALPERRGWLGRQSKEMSTEEWLQARANERDQLTAEFLDALREASGRPLEKAAGAMGAVLDSFFDEMEKVGRAGHVIKRLNERAPGVDSALLPEIEAAANRQDLDTKRSYHAPLPGGAYVVLGPVGKGDDRRHVIKTVLSPSMRPPGRMLRGMPRTVGTMADWKQLSSSNLEATRYDAGNKRLEIKFKGGGHYGYEDVPPVKARGLRRSRSAGKYFHRNIKGTYDHEKVAMDAFFDELERLGDGLRKRSNIDSVRKYMAQGLSAEASVRKAYPGWSAGQVADLVDTLRTPQPQRLSEYGSL
jgi:superfamily II DNA or RNA helicase/RimJ/RimL family protein N-acetyltransferase